MIRAATIDDLHYLSNGIMWFWTGVDFQEIGISPDRETIENFLIDIMAAPSGIIYVTENQNREIGGGIIGVVEPWIFNKNVLMLTELGWFVLPEYREKHPFSAAFLFKKLREWAKAKGATVATFSSTKREESEMVQELYASLGYLNIDNNYMGRL